MFIMWSDADVDWVDEIEIVSSFECKYIVNPLGVLHSVHGGEEKSIKKWVDSKTHNSTRIKSF